jgi:hypothetical protein
MSKQNGEAVFLFLDSAHNMFIIAVSRKNADDPAADHARFRFIVRQAEVNFKEAALRIKRKLCSVVTINSRMAG